MIAFAHPTGALGRSYRSWCPPRRYRSFLLEEEREGSLSPRHIRAVPVVVGRTHRDESIKETDMTTDGLPTDDPPHIDSTGVATGDFIFRPARR